ncbi:MAG: hypothetical protein IKC54_04165, partial [Clostridia bacterium]|nr:hypothetical protein [Clostridia bacterium]
MKKKILCVLMIAVLVIGAVTMFACNPSNAGAQANFDVPAGGYDGSAVTLKFYHTMGENPRTVLEAHIVEFNKLYPNITIEHEQVG